MNRYVATIDQGTTSRRIVFGRRGEIIASAQKEHRQYYPKPGWVEHDPMEILHNTLEVVEAAGLRLRVEGVARRWRDGRE